MTNVLIQAAGVAARYIGSATVPHVNSFLDLLESLSQTEQRADSARLKLGTLASTGAVNQADLKDYDTLRNNLFIAQMGLYNTLVEHVPDFVSEYVPVPVKMPEITSASAPQTGTPLFRQLGQVAEGGAVAAGVALSPWMWATLVVLAVVGIIGTLYISYLTAEVIANVFVVWQQSRQYEDLLSRRWQAYSMCLQQGTSPAECAHIAAGVVPTPDQALPSLQGPLTMGKVLGYGALVVGSGALGFFGFKWWRKRK